MGQYDANLNGSMSGYKLGLALIKPESTKSILFKYLLKNYFSMQIQSASISTDVNSTLVRTLTRVSTCKLDKR